VDKIKRVNPTGFRNPNNPVRRKSAAYKSPPLYNLITLRCYILSLIAKWYCQHFDNPLQSVPTPLASQTKLHVLTKYRIGLFFCECYWAVHVATAHVVTRRKCRGVESSRTFHPVPGCRRFIGWYVSGVKRVRGSRPRFLVWCLLRQTRLGFWFSCCKLRSQGRPAERKGRSAVHEASPRQTGTGGTVSEIEFGCGILNFCISACGAA